MVRWLGFDFLHASASAKLLNLASNMAALALFISTGHIWWHLVYNQAGAAPKTKVPAAIAQRTWDVVIGSDLTYKRETWPSFVQVVTTNNNTSQQNSQNLQNLGRVWGRNDLWRSNHRRRLVL